jgi:hypothetical protein
MGSLLADATAMTTKKGGKCSVYVLLQTLEPGLLAELNEALDSRVESTALSKALIARGYDIRREPLQRHRRGECACPR